MFYANEPRDKVLELIGKTDEELKTSGAWIYDMIE